MVPSAPKVLVVDDELSIRDCCESAAGGGYEVAVACDGLEARKALESGSFDLVITDLVMLGERGHRDHPGDTKKPCRCEDHRGFGAFGGVTWAVARCWARMPR